MEDKAAAGSPLLPWPHLGSGGGMGEGGGGGGLIATIMQVP